MYSSSSLGIGPSLVFRSGTIRHEEVSCVRTDQPIAQIARQLARTGGAVAAGPERLAMGGWRLCYWRDVMNGTNELATDASDNDLFEGWFEQGELTADPEKSPPLRDQPSSVPRRRDHRRRLRDRFAPGDGLRRPRLISTCVSGAAAQRSRWTFGACLAHVITFRPGVRMTVSTSDATPRSRPARKKRRYSDGHPLDRVQYVESKLILNGDRFTSVDSFARVRQAGEATAKDAASISPARLQGREAAHSGGSLFRYRGLSALQERLHPAQADRLRRRLRGRRPRDRLQVPPPRSAEGGRHGRPPARSPATTGSSSSPRCCPSRARSAAFARSTRTTLSFR